MSVNSARAGSGNAQVPPHVPASLVWDNGIETYSMELDDPYESMARLHGGPEILWSTYGFRGKPAWLLVSFDAMQSVFMDHEHFSGEQNGDSSEILGVKWRLNPLEYDPPEHMQYRKFLNPFFTPGAVNGLATLAEQICDELIAKFQERGSCEYVTEFAELFPSYIFLGLMGLPKDMVQQFLTWEREFLWGTEPESRIEAARGILAYLEQEIAKRRANPTDDMISSIVHGEIAGRPITQDEILGMCYVLYLGGLDTVMSMLGWMMRHLASNPELQQRLRENCDLIPKAIDEMLRAFPVVTMRRVVKKDVVLRGVEMKVGDQVLLPTSLAGRDPSYFENPNEIDPDRKGARTLTFGTGVHSCLGVHLARRELRIVFTAFLRRFKEIRLADPENIQFHTGINWGVDKLQLALVAAD